MIHIAIHVVYYIQSDMDWKLISIFVLSFYRCIEWRQSESGDPELIGQSWNVDTTTWPNVYRLPEVDKNQGDLLFLF